MVNQKVIDKVIEVANISLRKAIVLFGDQDKWKDRRGGALCFADEKSGLLHAVTLLGETPIEKVGKWLALCQEKARRLAANRGHLSSWQTRNPPLMWGGAISFDGYILSFSGLPELGDEAIMLKTAQMVNNLRMPEFDIFELEHLDNIAHMSDNPFWPPLRDYRTAPL